MSSASVLVRALNSLENVYEFLPYERLEHPLLFVSQRVLDQSLSDTKGRLEQLIPLS